MSSRLFKLGLLINPYAGIGGALALKGSDGTEIREKALALGAQKKALDKTRLALQSIVSFKNQVLLYVAAGEMGESLAKELGFKYSVVYQSINIQTEAQDTENTAQALLSKKVDLILFAGGDGTARNICQIVGNSVPVLGVPAGCKIHSAVYAITPAAAGRVLEQVIKGEIVSVNDAEVMDIDEAQFRQGRVNARQFGEMQVPTELRYIQAVKMGGKESDELVLQDIADHIIEIMEDHPHHIFVMGSGSTGKACLTLNRQFIGIEMEEDLHDDWDEVTAEVIRNDESGLEYRINDANYGELEGELGYDLDYFLDNTPGTLTLSASVCDLVSRFIIPKDSGEEFMLWLDPDKASQQSCVPITRDMSSVYIILGAILMGLSAIRLIRTINAAALRA